MKILIALAATLLLAVPGVAFAQDNTSATATVSATQQAQSGALSSSSITIEGAEAPDIPRQTPSAYAPSLAASAIGCDGSGVAALSVDRASVSLGRTRAERGCANARRANVMRAGGTALNRAAADIMYCNTEEEAARAYASLGYTCEAVGRDTLQQLQQQARPPQTIPSGGGSEVVQPQALRTDAVYGPTQ